MPVPNPLFKREAWTLKKFRATVFNDIWPEILFFSAIATMVTLVSEMTTKSLGISNQMLTVLGIVLGLVISFRTSSAYEKYQDGRKLWGNIIMTSRNIATMVWVHVPSIRGDQFTQEKKPVLEAFIEKKSIINLVQAYSVSVKHFLRAEPGVYYQDLYPLISFLPRYAVKPPVMPTTDDLLPLWTGSSVDNVPNSAGTTMQNLDTISVTPSIPQSGDELHLTGTGALSHRSTFRRQKIYDNEKGLPIVEGDQPLYPAYDPPRISFFDYFGLIRFLRPFCRFVRGRSSTDKDKTLGGRQRRNPMDVDSTVPLEIALYLNRYLSWLLKNKLLDGPIGTAFINELNALQHTMTSLEMIRNTPLPFAYQTHLRITLWIYLFFLPFQIYDAFKWLTIPVSAFASFLLLGFLEIGQEIENPFNYDENDLDLDHFCLMIKRELHEITAHSFSDPPDFIFTPWNQPFAPGDHRTATDMQRDVEQECHNEGLGVDIDSIQRTLLRSWRAGVDC